MFNRKFLVRVAIGVAVVAVLIVAVLLWPERSTL
jgi:hypothetical protein